MLAAGVLAFATTSPARVVVDDGQLAARVRRRMHMEPPRGGRSDRASRPRRRRAHARLLRQRGHRRVEHGRRRCSARTARVRRTPPTPRRTGHRRCTTVPIPVEPGRLFAYYRVPPIAGPRSARPAALSAGAGDGGRRQCRRRQAAAADRNRPVVGWHCGASPDVSATPRQLRARRPAVAARDLSVLLGRRAPRQCGSSFARGVCRRPTACPSTHPVVLPELTMDVVLRLRRRSVRLRLASGGVLTGHADFLNAWAPAGARHPRHPMPRPRARRCGIAPVRAEASATEPR